MKCENVFCIYEYKGKCRIKGVTLDIMGKCTECIYVDLDQNILNEAKNKILKQFNN